MGGDRKIYVESGIESDEEKLKVSIYISGKSGGEFPSKSLLRGRRSPPKRRGGRFTLFRKERGALRASYNVVCYQNVNIAEGIRVFN